MQVGAIVVDEHDDEWIARSLAASTMGADAGRRGDEVVVNPPLNSRLVGPRLCRLLRPLADGRSSMSLFMALDPSNAKRAFLPIFAS